MILIVSAFAISQSPQYRQSINWPEAKSALIEAIWELPLPFIVLGGIYGGFFTVTEAASVTVVYVILIQAFIYKDLDMMQDLPGLMKESMILVGTILIILGTAMGFTNYLVDEQIPMTILEGMKQYIHDPLTFHQHRWPCHTSTFS